MSKSAKIPQGIREVQAGRISTDDGQSRVEDEICGIAVEEPVTIEVQDGGTYTVLCTPHDRRAMAVGFLFSEGLIDGVRDIALMNECIDAPAVIRVRLNEGAPKVADQERHLLIVSSCGVCGSERMAEKLAAMPRVGDTLRIKKEILRKASLDVREQQVIFDRSGGTHAIGLYDSAGTIVSFAEDIGRHNALDKAIGKCLLSDKPTTGLAAALSGRVSLEMVGKCARAGIEIISAVSAPTSLALEAALRCDITLLGFVRETRATIFTCPRRILLTS